MSTRPASTASIGDKTGRSWQEWLVFLEQAGARELPHKEIASLVAATGDASPWWAQAITVAWEQHIGRRAPGEVAGGTFQVSVSRTLPGAPEAHRPRLVERLSRRPDIDGVGLSAPARTSATDRRCYWRASLADGSAVSISIEARGEGRTLVVAAHDRLADSEAVARWRRFWKNELSVL